MWPDIEGCIMDSLIAAKTGKAGCPAAAFRARCHGSFNPDAGLSDYYM